MGAFKDSRYASQSCRAISVLGPSLFLLQTPRQNSVRKTLHSKHSVDLCFLGGGQCNCCTYSVLPPVDRFGQQGSCSLSFRSQAPTQAASSIHCLHCYLQSASANPVSPRPFTWVQRLASAGYVDVHCRQNPGTPEPKIRPLIFQLKPNEYFKTCGAYKLALQ